MQLPDAHRIDRRQFQRLSSRKQHGVLAALARWAIEKQDPAAFAARYAEIHSWSDLDRYQPPDWLTPLEALWDFFRFHRCFCPWLEEAPLTARLIDPLSWQPQHAFEIVVDQIRSPYNMGALIRACDTFGFKGVVYGSSWIRTDHAQLQKAARGCQHWIPLVRQPDLVGYLQRAAAPVIGIETSRDAVWLDNWRPPREGHLVLGNEAYGISDALRACCRQWVRIPMYGYKHAMNVVQAFSVVAYTIVTAAQTSPADRRTHPT
jgi:tRNA(Leu) C34 or U34 (ribose-2'-O)-methylase TrmL